ncbi:hypothetical protein VOLCADRAFT_121565 [Volvox carteri f. nagariensis]|uniref:26S proteasome complex subunit SEM1 n=1 Tax=Volvox carteri f. nagariensis TaxID=3068 RepID=D8UDQ9_VOLCA|nr:uncharacterized protein VOLCADRAFT_121565 [Volvox carteri f. nagariensis]EFJ42138.1 hypothetical protein VOLCADRAFT_121565 [Volvox carteri f. nagariensis]|eukprot:XP_002956835.1 hypothetical protein VOLCADRAFT_121565 [Volvox carteri f. nagariensis]
MVESKKADASKTAEQQPKEQQKKEAAADLLEADDLFEEFGNGEWHGAKDDEGAPLWEADWEDENVADDFTARLKAELDTRGMKE